MTGPLTLAADPTTDMQAATKQYVENNGGVNLRKNSHSYTAGNICYSKTAESYKYMQCTVAGTTAATEPTSWPDVGQTIQDGTVTWVVRDIRAGEQVGSIKGWLANAAPPGWLALDTGALVSRATYPQLWAWVQAYAPLITEAAWQTQAAAQTSVGAYSSGDGSTTFRLPKIVDFVRGTDGTRMPGTFQADNLKAHTHSMEGVVGNGFSPGNSLYTSGGGVQVGTRNTDATGDTETRPKSVAFLFCVKAFDAPTNQGLVDITALANSLQNKVNFSDFTSWGDDTNGGCKYPDGRIEQWGEFNYAGLARDTTKTISFPVPFPNAVNSVLITRDTVTTIPTTGMDSFSALNYTISGFDFQFESSGTTAALTGATMRYRAWGR